MDQTAASGHLKNMLDVPVVEPVDIANAVSWLSSDKARYITAVSLPVDAGLPRGSGAPAAHRAPPSREDLMDINDYIAIMNAFAAYSRGIDKDDWNLLREAFDEDSVWVMADKSEHHGIDEILAFITNAGGIRPWADIHNVFNIHLREVDADTVESTSSWVYYGRDAQTEPWRIESCGTYTDRLARGRHGWRFRYREIHNYDVEGHKVEPVT